MRTQIIISLSRRAYSILTPTLAALALGLLASSTHAAGRNPNPGILPIGSTPYGNSYGEWTARWWQWSLSIPADRNPVLDPQFWNESQSGPVWFYAGTFGGSGERSATMPAGKALFMPIFNVLFGAGVFDCEPTVPGTPCDVEALRATAAAVVESAADTEGGGVMEVTVDGSAIQDEQLYRAISPEPFSITWPENNLFGFPIPSGEYSPQVSDGYWLMLAPLGKGKHTIRVQVRVPAIEFAFDVTTNLTVE